MKHKIFVFSFSENMLVTQFHIMEKCLLYIFIDQKNASAFFINLCDTNMAKKFVILVQIAWEKFL